MDGQPRVLAVCDLYPNNIDPIRGIYLYNQLNRLVECGTEVTVISPVAWSSPFLSVVRKKWRKYLEVDRKAQFGRIRVEYPRYLRPPGSWFYPYSGMTCYLGVRRTAESIYKSSPFDIIYTNMLIPGGYVGCLLSHELSLPSVCYVGEYNLNSLSSGWVASKSMKYVILNSTRLVAVSRYERDRILEIANPLKPIEIIYRGTHTEVFQPSPVDFDLKKKLFLPKDALVVTFVGRLAKEKGVSDLLNAFAAAAPDFSNLYLLVIGEGPNRSDLELLAKKTGIKERIVFTGMVKNEDLPSYFSVTDIMVFPSHAEGLPNAVVEALSCGKPVVATDVGGIPEIVTHGINGFLTASGDIKMLSSNMMLLLKDATLRKKMGQEGRRIVEKRFNAKKNAEQLKNFFRHVVEEYAQAQSDKRKSV